MTGAEMQDQVLRTGAQLALLGDGTTDTAAVATQMGLSTRVVGAHVSRLVGRGLVDYVHGAKYPPQRWRLTAVGVVIVTTERPT